MKGFKLPLLLVPKQKTRPELGGGTGGDSVGLCAFTQAHVTLHPGDEKTGQGRGDTTQQRLFWG